MTDAHQPLTAGSNKSPCLFGFLRAVCTSAVQPVVGEAPVVLLGGRVLKLRLETAAGVLHQVCKELVFLRGSTPSTEGPSGQQLGSVVL